MHRQAPAASPSRVSPGSACLTCISLACLFCLQAVVNRAKRAVPYPVLGENTLVLADLLCVRPVAGGKGGEMELVCRWADKQGTVEACCWA